MEFDVLLITGVISALSLVAVISGMCIVQVKRAQRDMLALTNDLNDLKRQIATVNRGTVGVGQHLSALEKRLLTGLNKVEKQSLSEMSMLSYGDASRLMEQGVDADVLVKRCGMSRGEAELMCKLRKSA